FPDAGFDGPILSAAIQRVDAQSRRSEDRRRTLETKADALRAAAIVLGPAQGVSDLVDDIGATVAPLMFAPALDTQDWPHLDRLGRSGLDRALERSLSCGSGKDAARVRQWVGRWLTTGVEGWVREVLERRFREARGYRVDHSITTPRQAPFPSSAGP